MGDAAEEIGQHGDLGVVQSFEHTGNGSAVAIDELGQQCVTAFGERDEHLSCVGRPASSGDDAHRLEFLDERRRGTCHDVEPRSEFAHEQRLARSAQCANGAGLRAREAMLFEEHLVGALDPTMHHRQMSAQVVQRSIVERSGGSILGHILRLPQ